MTKQELIDVIDDYIEENMSESPEPVTGEGLAALMEDLADEIRGEFGAFATLYELDDFRPVF